VQVSLKVRELVRHRGEDRTREQQRRHLGRRAGALRRYQPPYDHRARQQRRRAEQRGEIAAGRKYGRRLHPKETAERPARERLAPERQRDEGDDDHRNLFEVIGLPLHSVDDAEHLVVAGPPRHEAPDAAVTGNTAMRFKRAGSALMAGSLTTDSHCCAFDPVGAFNASSMHSSPRASSTGSGFGIALARFLSRAAASPHG
jgi:hypothetical protein